MRPRLRRLLILALAVGATNRLFADDRDLLKSPTSAPSNVMVLLSNDEEMAKCFPSIGQFNGLPCPTVSANTYALAYGGMGDSLFSKFGVAKNVLRNVIQTNIAGTPTSRLNWGITSFATNNGNFQTNNAKKRYQFQAVEDTFQPSDGWAYQPATWSQTVGGVTTSGPAIISFGAPVGTANDVTMSSVVYRQIQYSASTGLGSEAWVQNPGGDTLVKNGPTVHQPYSGSTGTANTLIWNPSDTRYEVLVSTPTLPSGSTAASVYRIKRCIGAAADAACTLNAGTFPTGFNGDYFTVTKKLLDCSDVNPGKKAPCDPLSGNIHVARTSTVHYVVPPIFCADNDSTCRFPTVYGYGTYSREEMGSTLYSEMQESNNNGGWAFQSNNNPQPMVMIAHDYPNFTPNGRTTPTTTAAQRNYVQSGGNCILRALRPGSAVYDNTANAAPGLSAEHDYSPIYDPTKANTDGTSLANSRTSGCDVLMDGAYQTDSYRLSGTLQPTEAKTQEIIPSMFPRNGSGNNVPLIGGLTNVFQYFNGGNNPGSCNAIVDGFCGGIRPDDPHGACRQNAVILVTDSLIPSTGTFQFGKPSDPTAQLAAINIPVYVVGFSYSTAPTNNACKLGDGTNGNTGQCIAFFTGATTYVNGKVDKRGYFEANDAAGLEAALNVIISELNQTNRDFATATIPSVSATSEGLAYFASFNPRTNKSVWSGHLRNYVINPLTGVVDTNPTTGEFNHAPFTFWTGSTPSFGNEVWDVGNGGDPADNLQTGILGNSALTDPKLVLSAHTAWSDTTHDQATLFGSAVGRNMIFGLRPGDANCPAGNAVQCAVQLPPGINGVYTEPYTPPSPPSTLPNWWDPVRTAYMGVSSVRAGEADINQTTQNNFSFFRGNRDPVVEALQLVGFSTASTTTCAGIDAYNGGVTSSATVLTPCYRGEVMGDIFHSNPILVSFPFNVSYLSVNDPSASSVGLYSNRGNSYFSFFRAHRFRRKVLFAGSDDGFLHAFDLGIFNGDLSTFIPDSTQPSKTVSPLKGAYDFGSGREIFAYAPLAALRKFDALTHTYNQDYTVDGASTSDDVYIDLTNAGGTPTGVPSPTSATSTDSNHAWRTIVVGVEREGGLAVGPSPSTGKGGTIFALDVTDPDNPEHQNSNLNTDPLAALDLTQKNGASGFSPDCLVNAPGDGTLGTKPSGCNQATAYPLILWEMSDSNQPSTVPDASVPGTPAESSGSAEATTQDMGRTWSRPQIGRVKICTSACGGTPVYSDFFVAIAGAGYEHSGADPQSVATTNVSGNTGNFIYMIDVETGKVIWKRNIGLSGTPDSSTSAGNLPAGVPGEPSLVDYNGDGYADRIYIGDTQGRMWKVALDLPAVWDSANHRVSDTDTNWNPTLFFDEFQATTAADMATKFGAGAVRQPIFERAGVSLLSNTASGPKLVVAFGTGDRDNMPTSPDVNPNFFVVAVDDPTRPASDYPIFLNKSGGTTDLTLVNITATNPGTCGATNCLFDRGYDVQLPVGTDGAQVVNTSPLIFNNTIFFNSFLRRVTDPLNPLAANPCNLTGQAFAYALNFFTGISEVLKNGAPALPDAQPNVLIASDPIVYQFGGNVFPYTTDSGTNVLNQGDASAFGTSHAIFATDLGAKEANKGTRPNVDVKSWKEQ